VPELVRLEATCTATRLPWEPICAARIVYSNNKRERARTSGGARADAGRSSGEFFLMISSQGSSV